MTTYLERKTGISSHFMVKQVPDNFLITTVYFVQTSQFNKI